MSTNLSQPLEKLKPRPDDLLVLPEGYVVPENPGFLVCTVKHLKNPSIIRSGGSTTMLETMISNTKFSGKGLLGWLFGNKPVSKIDEAIAQASGSGMFAGEDIPTSEASAVLSTDTSSEVSANPPRFFRYIRELDATGEFKAMGGATLAIDMLPAENKLRFSYALCSPEDRFNKRAGRKICDERFKGNDFYEVENLADILSAVENIANAIENYLTEGFGDNTLEVARFSKISLRTSEQDLKNILRIF